MDRAAASVRIWDLPTRVFHWALALAVVFSWATGAFGGSGWREWHFRSGYAIFALLVFRLLWGFAGARYARFTGLRLSPVAAWHELRHPEPIAGHSAAATLSVIAMLAVLAVQVITGLFATDGSFTEGPWARYASHATVATLTSVHAINRWLVLTLVALHLAAIAVYAVRRDPLVSAIWHGNRAGLPAGTPAAEDDTRLRLRAAIFAALAIALTAYLTSP
jgi:cytochrome b